LLSDKNQFFSPLLWKSVLLELGDRRMDSGTSIDDFANGSEAGRASNSIEQWIREAKLGSQSSLGHVLGESRKYLLMVANRSLGPELRVKLAASDLVQDTFVEAQRDFGQFKGTTEEELLQWLTAILAHRLSNQVRHWRTCQKRSIDREVPHDVVDVALSQLRDDSITPSAALITQDEVRRLRLALAQLEPPLRSILLERNWNRSSFAEIGAVRGCSAEAARKQWSSALRKLKEALDDVS
jgi:RNA polymerase sigma-70 factor (ECF subfamily)